MQFLFHQIFRVHYEEGMKQSLCRTPSPYSLHPKEDHEGLVTSHGDSSPQSPQEDIMQQALSKDKDGS